jgi:hypothetical protein
MNETLNETTNETLNKTQNKTMNTLNFTFNFNAPVGQNIAHVDRLEAHFDKEMTMQVVDTASLTLGRANPAPTLPEERLVCAVNAMSPLPEVLLTDEARELHARLVEAGMVDEGWMPVGLSFTEKGTLIDYVAERLDIRAKWKLFGALWHTDPETLRTSKARGRDQDKTWAFRSRLDAL